MTDHSKSTLSSMGKLDQLKADVTFEQVAAYYGTLLPELQRSGDEVRLACFLNCGKTEPTGNRAIAINTSTPDARWKCHQYGCTRKGDLVTLAHLLKPGFDGSENPRGDRFKAILSDLEAIAGGTVPSGGGTPRPAVAAAESPRAQPEVNLPLKDSANERARELTNLDAKFIVEPDEMSPAAASYFRRRPWLTPGLAKQWRMGYLPKDSGGDRSGGTMRGKVVYPLVDGNGDVLAWFGRDPEFEANHQKWLQSGRAGVEPIKTRFVKGFHRGLELFGQHRNWQALREREAFSELGLLVVEGPNDVMRLDTLLHASVGLCGNQITAEQTDKIAAIASEFANRRVTLLLDTDAEGEAGAKQVLWELAQRGLQVQLGWSRTMFAGKYADRQPESMTDEELNELIDGRNIRE